MRAILLNMGVYPQMVESVQGRALPAVASLTDCNRAKTESSFPNVDWPNLTITRGGGALAGRCGHAL